MKITNKTRGTEISSAAGICVTVLEKARGLMFSRQKDLLFVEKKEKYIPLHMFFVFFPIDILYLNGKKQVVEIKEQFQPFSFYSPKKKAQYVIELKSGAVKRSKTEVTDCLVFQ